MNEVKAWIEDVSIPTYEIGQPEKNPVFLEKRVYQGSSGVVYPYPVIEKISDEKTKKIWKAIYLENDYLKIMILPELGGRVQMAYDKIKKRHFVYYNEVIKPALVGLTGPWISGGIEFNWPQHHRPSTYEPVDYCIKENKDGSKTVWCSEIERMFRTKGMAGFTLYPDKAFMEIKVKLYNRTSNAQTFLWWANPAVKVNDHYQSIFPPDVNAVFDHGKRDVSTFPIATGTYYKVDYSKGVDISRYKNIPVPTSYMAIKSNYNFIGCYEHDTQGGMLHVANHHISPGKKQWTWGNGDFGYAWDRNLTDDDGPYIELMCGVYTDNQPDFSWLMPYEEKSFSQYFLPFHEIGIVKNASKDALINLESVGEHIELKVYVTSVFNNASIKLTYKNESIITDFQDLRPEKLYKKEVPFEKVFSIQDFYIEVKSAEGKTLVYWKPEAKIEKPVPEPAKTALPPEEIKENEELYLTGLHLEQYRHASFQPADYYKEALSRNTGDIRCNNAMGLLWLKKGQFEKAESYFSKAIETLTKRNPNPYDGEPYFNLGLALRYQLKDDAAYDAFFKSVWNDAWQGAGYFQLALIDTKKGNLESALDLVNRSLVRQWHNHKARHLKAIVLRKLDQKSQAMDLIGESLDIDPFNYGALYEKYLNSSNKNDLTNLKKLLRSNIHNYIEIALDYYWTGMNPEAISLLQIGIEERKQSIYPMAWYYLALFSNANNQKIEAQSFYQKAELEYPGTCFPNQLESVIALKECIANTSEHAMADYYLGNFLYHTKQYQLAVNHWENSIKNKSGFPTSHRNLALAYYNKLDKKELALEILEKAFELDPSDSRVFMELDALYKRMNKNYGFRLEKLKQNMNHVEFRDDVYLEYLSLYTFTEDHQKAYELLLKRKFHPWEGGEGKVTGQYLFSLIELAKKHFIEEEYEKAIEKLTKAKSYPHNLGEGKLIGALDNDIEYWIGTCHEKLSNDDLAKSFYTKAIAGNIELSPAMYYNDQQPDKIFYQGLALRKLKREKEARQKFTSLVNYGKEHLHDKIKIDYFAVSLPDLMIWDDDLNNRNQIFCQYLMALGNLGLGNTKDSQKILDKILKRDLYHVGAFVHSRMITNELI